MNKITKWIVILLGSATMVAIAAGAMVFFFTSRASANVALAEKAGMRINTRTGGPGFPGNQSGGQEALAKALGITVEELQLAEQKASDAAIQQALKEGLITQDQADEMTLRGFPFRFGFGGRGKFSTESRIDYDALLADALDISVEKLQTAREEARADMLAEAVANGSMTQEQVDMMKARDALRDYLDPNTLLAKALGISTDQLQTYHKQGMTMSQILAKAGKTAIKVREAQQAAYQAAVEKAVADKVITQAQADQIQGGSFRGMGEFGGGPRQGCRCGGVGGFGDGWKPAPYPTPPAP